MGGRVATEFGLILALVLANGCFAMAEMAFVTARRARLAALARRGDRKAAAALALVDAPERILSTVQIGITLIGILAGALGGATLAQELGVVLDRWPPLHDRGEAVAFAGVVVGIAFLSLILGELVPKRLALAHPETVARHAAGPMRAISLVAAPAVWVLSRSSRFVTRLLGLTNERRASVTEEEIRLLVVEAATSGALEQGERLLVERVLHLGDLRVAELMTPRPEVVWLNLELPPDEIVRVLATSEHARLPAARGELDRVEGVVRVRRPLGAAVVSGEGAPLDLRQFLQPPTFVPETQGALAAIEALGRAPSRMLLVVDEHGSLQGVVTEADLLGRLAADLAPGLSGTAGVVERADGAVLADGALPLVDLKRLLGVDRLPGESRGAFRTLAGFALTRIGHVPAPGEQFEWNGWRFEIVDLDGRRIDKLLLRRASRESGEPEA